VRLPRDLSGADLAKRLGVLGYVVTRQAGSHMRLTRPRDVTTKPPRDEHHITIPAHDALRVGTLSGILSDIAGHLGTTTDEIARRLFG
jgi:predicted RNA binding protein YcfA (HicA-like mRNA interferase family)